MTHFGTHISPAVHTGIMRQPADWMRPPDDRILEAVREYGNLTPKAASKEGLVDRVDISRKYAGVRMRELTEYGLLSRVDEGLYSLTDHGHAYLDEKLDASGLDASGDEPDIETKS